jgi:hypothetical protein
MYFGKEFPNQIAPSRTETGIYLDDAFVKSITPIYELPRLKERIHFRTELDTRLFYDKHNLKNLFQKVGLQGKVAKKEVAVLKLLQSFHSD